MKISRQLWSGLPAYLLAMLTMLTMLSPSVHAAQQLLIIGDSLSKEYEYEGDYIGGADAPAGLHSWTEILDDKRHSYFDFGTSSTYADVRLLGHRHNWSIPGSFASEWINKYLTANFPLNYTYGIPELESQLNGSVERVVIFLGGNEIRSQYGNLYDGNLAPSTFASGLFNDLEDIVNWVLDRRASGTQVVLANLPHLGACPDKNDAHPYNVTKTGRVTSAITNVNGRLQTLAQTKGIGYADIYSTFSGLVNSDHLCIGGVPIWRYPVHSDGDPRYCFLGDGLHPNMPVQAIIAQIILDAFNTKYGTTIPRLTNTEILTNVLGLSSDLVFTEWLAGYGVPASQRGFAADPDKDGVQNLMEYALDLDPGKSDSRLLPKPETVVTNGITYVGITWKPRLTTCPWGTLYAQQSSNLVNWNTVAAGNVTWNPTTQTQTVRIARPVGSPPLFLRLKAEILPPT